MAASGLRSQVEGLNTLTREHDLQLDQQRRAIAALDEEKERIKALIEALDSMINARITSELQALRDEVNHKFSVQVAENKRLQSQMQKHASDMSKLLRLMEGMNARLKQAETEIGLV